MTANEIEGSAIVDETRDLWSKRVGKSMSFTDLRRLERAARVLRLHNRGVEVDEIADRESLTPGQVAEDIRLALRSYIDETAEDTVARHRAVMQDALHTMLAVMIDIGAKDADRVKAGATVVRILANEAKLLGLNAPTKLEVGGATGDDFAAVAAALLGQLGRDVPPVLAAAAARVEPTTIDAEPDPIDPDLGKPGGPDDQVFGGLDPWID